MNQVTPINRILPLMDAIFRLFLPEENFLEAITNAEPLICE